MQDLAIHPVELNILLGITLLRIHFFLRQKRALDEEQEQDQQEKLDQEHQEQDKLNQEKEGLNQEHQEQEHLEQGQVGSREILNEVGRY